MTFDLAAMIAKLRDPELIVSRTNAADTLEYAAAEIIRLTARVAAFEDALNPNLTKAEYIGEVKTDFVQAVEDEDGDIIDRTHEVMISWTAMKQFMAMISARAALSTPKAEGPKV